MKSYIKSFLDHYKKKKETWMETIEQNVVDDIRNADVIHYVSKDILADLNKHIELLEIQVRMLNERINWLQCEKMEIIKNIKD